MRPLAALALLVLVSLAGCGDDDAGAPITARDPDVRGTITSIEPFVPVTEDCVPADDLDPDGAVSSDDPPICTDDDHDVVGTVLVEERPGDQGDVKISFTVRAGTSIVDEAGQTLAFDELAEGDEVAAWSTGPVADSYPQQASAASIRRERSGE